jgi:hypothetical protein
MAVSQKVLQEHLATKLLNFLLIALPDRDDIHDEARDTDTERSLGSRSTVQHIEEDSQSSVLLEELPQDQPDDADTSRTDTLWSTVWTSPKLRESVRESYSGPAHDETIKHIARKQEQIHVLEQTKYPLELTDQWIPGVYCGSRKLLSPRLLERDGDAVEPQTIYLATSFSAEYIPVIKGDEYEKFIEELPSPDPNTPLGKVQ